MRSHAYCSPRDIFLNDGHLRFYWSVLGGLKEPYGTFFRFLLLSGRRGREVANAKWEHINLEARIWEIDDGWHFPDLVPLSDWACVLLKEVGPAASGPVFADLNGRHGDEAEKRFLRSARTQFKTRFSRPALDRECTLHAVRYNVVTRMRSLGVSSVAVAAAIGTDPNRYMTYLLDRSQVSFARSAVLAWEQALRTILADDTEGDSAR